MMHCLVLFQDQLGETSFIAITDWSTYFNNFWCIGSWRIMLSTFIGGYLTALLFNLWEIKF